MEECYYCFFIQKWCAKLIKSNKDIYDVQISFLFYYTLYSSKSHEKNWAISNYWVLFPSMVVTALVEYIVNMTTFMILCSFLEL